MEMSFGNKRTIKVFKDNKCVNIGIPKNNLLTHLDSIGMIDVIDSRTIFRDLSGNDTNFTLQDFDFNNTVWLDNSLHFDGVTSHLINETSIVYNIFTVSLSIHVPLNGKFICSLPGINYMYSENKDLYIVCSSNKIKISNCIESNTFYNIILTYEIGRLTVYLNGIKKYTQTNVTKGYNKKFLLGKDIANKYGEFMLHSLIYYDKALSKTEIQTLTDVEKSRYIVYYENNLVLDCRGLNSMLNYGGFISIRDNSPKRNHLRCKDWYTHFPKARAYTLTGINSMSIVGRPLLLDSFTIEIMFSKVRYMFAERVFLLGKYKENEYGIELLLDVKGLIIRLHNKNEDIFEYRYPLAYDNKRNHIAVAYDKSKKELSLYSNGYKVKQFKDINYTDCVSDMTLEFAKKKGYFPYIGNINSIRIYDTCIDPKCIASNYNEDIRIYKQ